MTDFYKEVKVLGELTEEQKKWLDRYNCLKNNPPFTLFADNETLDKYYDELLDLEFKLKDILGGSK